MTQRSGPFVKSIWIYPVKSLSGIELTEAKATPEGFEWDRRWMLVDIDGKFLTQREFPILARFRCEMDKSRLHISFEADSVSMPLKPETQSLKNVRVWDSSLKAGLEATEINRWFSDRLGCEAFLVRMKESYKRTRNITKAPYQMDVSFADGYPYLILSEASLEELNRRLDEPVAIDRFRANIVVEGCKNAHEEDGWIDYKIGSARFRNIKPCPRCVIVTIDQETAEKTSEPLKTLAQYRRVDHEVLFGVNAICPDPGIISQGQDIEQIDIM